MDGIGSRFLHHVGIRSIILLWHRNIIRFGSFRYSLLQQWKLRFVFRHSSIRIRRNRTDHSNPRIHDLSPKIQIRVNNCNDNPNHPLHFYWRIIIRSIRLLRKNSNNILIASRFRYRHITIKLIYLAFVNAVQFLYSLAILLSTPLQLFPAIRILEYGTGLALRSGKQNPYIKWKKNLFRAAFVIMTAGISALGANSLERFVSLTGSLTWYHLPIEETDIVSPWCLFIPLYCISRLVRRDGWRRVLMLPYVYLEYLQRCTIPAKQLEDGYYNRLHT